VNEIHSDSESGASEQASVGRYTSDLCFIEFVFAAFRCLRFGLFHLRERIGVGHDYLDAGWKDQFDRDGRW